MPALAELLPEHRLPVGLSLTPQSEEQPGLSPLEQAVWEHPRIKELNKDLAESGTPSTPEHEKRDMVFAHRAASELGFTEANQTIIAFGAALHDTGKAEMADIVESKGKPTESERAILEEHPELGFWHFVSGSIDTETMLKCAADGPDEDWREKLGLGLEELLGVSTKKANELTDKIAVLILTHHDWFNNTDKNYPKPETIRMQLGRAGIKPEVWNDEGVKTMSNLLAIEDVLDALTIKRPYHQSKRTFDEIVGILLDDIAISEPLEMLIVEKYYRENAPNEGDEPKKSEIVRQWAKNIVHEMAVEADRTETPTNLEPPQGPSKNLPFGRFGAVATLQV